MASTYVPIMTYTATGSSSTINFSSFSGYTDLVLVNSIKITSAPASILVNYNSDSGSNYSYTYLAGSGSSAISGRAPNTTGIQVDYITDTSIFGSGRINIENYSNATTYKTLISRQDYANAYTTAYVGLWRNTAAITSLAISVSAGNFASGSTFTLYGIKAA